ncbi:hypothetical protein D3C87_1073360 [compost metagenome]
MADAFSDPPAADAGAAAGGVRQCGLPARQRAAALPGLAAPPGRGRPAGAAGVCRAGAVRDGPAHRPVRLDPGALLGPAGGAAGGRLCAGLCAGGAAPARLLVAAHRAGQPLDVLAGAGSGGVGQFTAGRSDPDQRQQPGRTHPGGRTGDPAQGRRGTALQHGTSRCQRPAGPAARPCVQRQRPRGQHHRHRAGPALAVWVG